MTADGVVDAGGAPPACGVRPLGQHRALKVPLVRSLLAYGPAPDFWGFIGMRRKETTRDPTAGVGTVAP
jgi:hypothetical protein